jgi:hypothetical protein
MDSSQMLAAMVVQYMCQKWGGKEKAAFSVGNLARDFERRGENKTDAQRAEYNKAAKDLRDAFDKRQR